MAIKKTPIAHPKCCDQSGKPHEVLIFFDEENLNYIPLLMLPGHDEKEIFELSSAYLQDSSLLENNETCIAYAVNWMGGFRWFVLPDPSTNTGPQYAKFLAKLNRQAIQDQLDKQYELEELLKLLKEVTVTNEITNAQESTDANHTDSNPSA